ncbi:MAG: GNAT family N-acetyltransferase [Rhodospirillales bacterium]|nr:GNAT family N-acetyltransferase [Rhodospirillales bacterium]MDE2319644.1 GNAT family N-acetyltransferase [Rhodospirillales bacterium]
MTTLRPARAGEGQALYGITKAAVEVRAAAHYSAAQISGWMNGRDGALYEALIAAGGITVAAERDAVLGYVEAVPGEITRLFVHPEAAGRGLGRRLLERGIAMAGPGEIRLNATLNAAPFYEHCGFIPLGREMYCHDGGNEPVEVVKMLRPG